MEIICKRCKVFEQDEEQLLSTLKTYRDSLSEEERVPQEIYEQRLAICESCESLTNGLCGFCGCFVIVRAIKKRMNCPHPKGEKWHKQG
ncbi:DUF6171 family protein [Cellulosilyticum sp. I15G10I2]|uniref:DUF6171 family protein n=1 Tax=Cellulosilyticum sp. I15G10I2 TaxID=1892843 RepID=UPI00085C2DEC|nr:DUF6171 family protein [Cellulosilyticum sp. I15G10I2]